MTRNIEYKSRFCDEDDYQTDGFECCVSCHGEWADGYGEPGEYFDHDKMILIFGCCGFKKWYEKKFKAQTYYSPRVTHE